MRIKSTAKKEQRIPLLWLLIVLLCAGGAGQVQQHGDADPRIGYQNPGLITKLAAGLTAIPLPMDWDHDGDLDLLVSSDDVPQRSLLFFENDGTGVFKPGRKLAKAERYLTISYTEQGPILCTPGGSYRDFIKGIFGRREKIDYQPTFYIGRDNQWKLVDWEGDDDLDLIIGTSDWREYGWDDRFDKWGDWQGGPLHGYVYLVVNEGTDSQPRYDPARKIYADGHAIDVYGCPSPNYVDWDGDGDLDLLTGEFLDRITFYENVGTRQFPKFKSNGYLQIDQKVLHCDLEMLQVVTMDWDSDGDPDLLVGQEDGSVAVVENLGKGRIASPRYLKQQADKVKCGALVTPWSCDWDHDGDEDLICGNSAGYVERIENLSGGAVPRWAAPVRLTAHGKEIRITAGDNLSIQGPCEAKWGYTAPCVADWDMDGLPDVILNSITGQVVYYLNVGTLQAPALDGPFSIKVNWTGAPTYPPWNWWQPKAGELITQWRTTPNALDLNHDGLTDLIMVDHEGFLAFYERYRDEKHELGLKPGRRIFYAAAQDNGYMINQDNQFSGDGNRDGVKDVIQQTAGGAPVYSYRVLLEDAGQREMVTRTAAGGLITSSTVLSKPAAADELLPLRLSTGWAGQSGRRNFVLEDWDGDGDLDLIVNSTTVRLMENIGQNSQFIFRDRGSLASGKLAGHSTAPTTVDWNHDGVRELLIGAEDGYLYYYSHKSVNK
jgi:hypothetical protein